MKQKTAMFVLCILLTFPLTESRFNANFYKGAQVLRVVPDTDEKVKEIREIHRKKGLERLDLWMPTFKVNHPADIYATRKELPVLREFLDSRNISHSVLVKNVSKAILQQRTLHRRDRYKNDKYDYEQFHKLGEIHKELLKLANEYKSFTEIVSMGRSYEGRDMKAIHIYAQNKRKQRIFFIECGTHAREWISPATCMWLIKTILEERQKMKNSKMKNRIDWLILPVLNVDGYKYSWSKIGRFWRKNRRPNNGSTCIGTDLNRNWGYKWGGNGSSDDPCSSSYRGRCAFSENETKNVAKYLYKHRCDLLGYIGLHSYSQLWMTPWGYKTDKPEHYKEMKRVADTAVKAIANSGAEEKYETPGPSSEVIYKNSGSSKDWTYGALHIQYSYGVELRPHFNGSHGFLIPADQIKPSGQEIYAAIKAISSEIHLYEGRRRLKRKKSPKHK